MTNAVVTTGLTKNYKTTLAVDNINIQIPTGTCCGFLGKNGAGKTTTIRMLAGLLPPTGGKVEILGEERIYGKTFAPSFGYLPDVPNFYGYMRGDEFLRLCGRLCHMPEGELGPRIKELLTHVGLEKVRTKISGYSRGMKQRLGIAQSMINSPKLILMDEPISALDPIGRRDISDIIKKLEDTTVILSTHILADVEDICDYVLIIEKGKILAQDYMSNLKERFSTGAVKLRFYNQEDAEKFSALCRDWQVTKDRIKPNELFLKHPSLDSKAAGSQIIKMLGESRIPCEYFGALAASLEEIFYEVTENA